MTSGLGELKVTAVDGDRDYIHRLFRVEKAVVKMVYVVCWDVWLYSGE